MDGGTLRHRHYGPPRTIKVQHHGTVRGCSRRKSGKTRRSKVVAPNLSLRWHFNTFRPPAIQILAAPLAASSQQAMRGPIGGVALWGRRKKRKSQVPAALFHQPPFCRRTTQSIYAAQQTCAAPQLFPLRGHSLSLSLSQTPLHSYHDHPRIRGKIHPCQIASS